jgi:hypothetical protein
VAVVSARNAWAVGNAFPGRALILHWDGRAWTRVPSPGPSCCDFLNGVAASSACSAWAVGYRSGINKALILHWDGKTWK